MKPKPKTSELVPIITRHPKAVRTLLKIVAAERGMSIQDLIAEQINEILKKAGKDPIA